MLKVHDNTVSPIWTYKLRIPLVINHVQKSHVQKSQSLWNHACEFGHLPPLRFRLTIDNLPVAVRRIVYVDQMLLNRIICHGFSSAGLAMLDSY